MNLRTEINPRYLMRMGLVGLACLAMTAYCLYDGFVAWPAQREQALAYLEFEEAHPEVGAKDKFDLWKVEAEKRGWDPGYGGKPVTPYGEPKKPYEIGQQFAMAAVVGLISLIFIGKFFLNRGRWIEADEDGMRSSENRELKFDQVTALNKKKWDNKGIARVMYEADGRKKTIVLDDCNYDRDTTNALLRHVEKKIGHD